jgi:DNA-binding NtrC family response regulator
MRTTLITAGYEVDDAKTGEEALGKVREFRPDLVLLDINMPGMGGHQSGADDDAVAASPDYRRIGQDTATAPEQIAPRERRIR